VDYDYLRTLGIQLLKGRSFSKEFATDSTSGILINEAAARELGWTTDNAVGKTIIRSGKQELKVIGVVNDFNYTSAKQKIAPLMMVLGGNYGGLIAKIKTADIQAFISNLKKQWDAFNPAGPLEYHFLDEKFAKLYASEEHTKKIFSAFAILALIIASLGLFGLSAYSIEQRTKEIGIRKVLGASVQNVLLLVSREFIVLVGIALIISIPVTWWAMHAWLQDFAYRINIGWEVFAMAGIIALLMALLTVSFQSIKAATANPVKSLRAE
jgi:putative ABC transport system permease protein